MKSFLIAVGLIALTAAPATAGDVNRDEALEKSMTDMARNMEQQFAALGLAMTPEKEAALNSLAEKQARALAPIARDMAVQMQPLMLQMTQSMSAMMMEMMKVMFTPAPQMPADTDETL
jgi:hypothetical protein